MNYIVKAHTYVILLVTACYGALSIYTYHITSFRQKLHDTNNGIHVQNPWLPNGDNVHEIKKSPEGDWKVRIKGLEPPRLSAPDPKSGAATNYAISAIMRHRKRYRLSYRHLSSDACKYNYFKRYSQIAPQIGLINKFTQNYGLYLPANYSSSFTRSLKTHISPSISTLIP